MRNPGGYAIIVDPDGPNREYDTTTCFHCSRVTHITPKMPPDQMGGLCRLCMKMICPKCVAIGTCDPWEEQMKRAEASYHARRSYGI